MKKLKGVSIGLMFVPFDWRLASEVEYAPFAVRLHLGPFTLGVTSDHWAASRAAVESERRVLDAAHAEFCEAWRQCHHQDMHRNATMFFARAQGVERVARDLGEKLHRPAVHVQALAAGRSRKQGKGKSG